ncbi:hypothetical protein ScPMuIL_017530 [Solemya velum]
MTTKSSNLRDIPQELNMGQNEEETEWLEHLQKHCISLGILQELEALSLCVRNLCHVTKNDLLTFTPVNIGDLLKLGNITHSNMYLAEETDTTSVSSTCTTLPNSRMLLIGCITRSSTTVTNDRDGVLVVKDCKDCVKCQIREVDSENIMSLLDSWVIFTKWNLLNSGREKILEICCPPVLLESPLRSGKKNIQVLTVEDAHYLLQNKETLNPGLVNIVGTVTAMSEKFRVKNDTLFLIKLADKVNILIKRKEYLHWQLLLIPQKEYVFINLRPTTLKKGGSSEVRIYVPWDRSSVSPKDQCKCFFVSSQEWVTNPAQSTGAPEAVLPDSECVEETLFSYQGEITNTDKLHDGILELDGKVRLFLCYIPPSYTFQSFRLGARITIHKAHRRGSVKPPRINLICCMMSCIKIAEFSPLDHQSREPQYPIYLQELLFHHGIAFSKLSYLLDLVADLRAKLCPKYISSTGKVMSVLLKKLHPDWFKEKNRKLLMEFLSHQGACLMKSKKMHDFLEVSQSQVLPVLTVSQVSSESPPDSLVSFQGLLVSRSHCEPEWMKHEKVLKRYPSDNLQSTNEKYGLSTLDNKVMKLIIRDCERSEEMPVYINLENISYPLGLVPGVVAEFSRMEKKISKRGRSYCSFIAVSSIRVLQMSKSLGMLRTRSAPDEPSATLMPTSYKGNMDSVPLLYLSQLWNNKVDTFRTICQIQQVTKLSVKSVCENCGELFGTAGCTVTACSHRTSKLQVRISIIVDDGTGVVMVTCNNIMVQHLLQLSVREWQGLEDFLKGRGEVLIYQNSFSPVNDLEKFLYRLCNSTGIKKKAWMMHLSLPYSSRPSDQTNTCAQLDTNTMDLEEFSYKTIDTGLAKFETRSLPLLHLYCQSLKPVLAVHWTMENLAS